MLIRAVVEIADVILHRKTPGLDFRIGREKRHLKRITDINNIVDDVSFAAVDIQTDKRLPLPAGAVSIARPAGEEPTSSDICFCAVFEIVERVGFWGVEVFAVQGMIKNGPLRNFVAGEIGVPHDIEIVNIV